MDDHDVDFGRVTLTERQRENWLTNMISLHPNDKCYVLILPDNCTVWDAAGFFRLACDSMRKPILLIHVTDSVPNIKIKAYVPRNMVHMLNATQWCRSFVTLYNDPTNDRYNDKAGGNPEGTKSMGAVYLNEINRGIQLETAVSVAKQYADNLLI